MGRSDGCVSSVVMSEQSCLVWSSVPAYTPTHCCCCRCDSCREPAVGLLLHHVLALRHCCVSATEQRVRRLGQSGGRACMHGKARGSENSVVLTLKAAAISSCSGWTTAARATGSRLQPSPELKQQRCRYLRACLSFYLCACLCVCLSLCLCVSVCLSICLSVCLSVYLSICVCPSMCVHLCVCLAVCLLL